MKNFTALFLISCGFLVCSCKEDPNTLFRLVSAEDSGIHFENNIIENDTINILENEYVYNGGGVGVGDFNNDGLPDVYFSGNMASNKLYLNEGGLKFKDVTEIAGVAGEGKWCTGVSVVDINQDGLLDIYVCASLNSDPTSRANMLFVNNGPDEDGIPTFSEDAARYGIANTGYSTMAAFFDYDHDGHLDMYLLDHEKPETAYKKKVVDGTALNNDHLYHNNGDGTFTDVSMEAGITFEGFGLGVVITDINMDGWPDVYVANDYLSNDLLWINNQDGTFTNRIKDYFKHQSYSSMGTDVSDINNDGLVDVVTLEMLPENNKRKKMMRRANNYTTYLNNQKFGFEYQYIRNTLQVNNGLSPNGNPVFSEIGMLSGIYQTDWSWTPLVADFDNDGFRDIIITNGFPKDVSDLDFGAYRSGNAGAVSSYKQLIDFIPSVKVSNYAYSNNGNLTFTDKTKAWGLELPSYSNGAVYTDLDNDGDLDLVVNNINDKAFLYENQLYKNNKENADNHYLRVAFEGRETKQSGTGAKVMINYGKGKKQFYEHTPYRGYLSTVEDIAHFGLGTHDLVDSLQVFWPDGRYQLLTNVPVDQEILIRQTDAGTIAPPKMNMELQVAQEKYLFRENADQANLGYKHQETDKVDFNMQVTLPHKFTQKGPGIGVGDVNGDGLADFYIGGSAGNPGMFFLQDQEGRFIASSEVIQGGAGEMHEDMGILFFDADGDLDQDLYVVSGSYEFAPGVAEHQDRLYINKGNGAFEIDTTALPSFFSNGSAVKAADFDRDGDLDLFVGGNVIPGQYPFSDRSYILINDGGKFVDVTDEIAPDLAKSGIVNDALWTDYDNDGLIDLILAGEWMPITVFKNNNGRFEDVTSSTGLDSHIGWWNSLSAGDFDNDGDIDYIAGNLGLNTTYRGTEEQPLRIYAKDFDGNGSIDPILSTYLKAEDGTYKAFPMHAKDDLTFLIPRMKKKFPKYGSYSMATIDDVLSPEDKEGALIIEANHMSSSYLENLGNGEFKLVELPLEVQFAPVFGMVSEDFDHDGNMDVVMVGNNYSTEVATGRYDAFVGLFLKGNGKGAFQIKGPDSGFFVDGDAKGIVNLMGSNREKVLLITQNQDSLKSFKVNPAGRAETVAIELEPMDAWAEIELENGEKIKKEFYYGSSYLSQSSRVLWINKNSKAVRIYDFSGKERKVSLNPEMIVSQKANKL